MRQDIQTGTSTIIPVAGKTTVDLVSAADAALYQAKAEGRICLRTNLDFKD